MRSTGAAKRQEQEQPQPPDGTSAAAELLRVTAEADAMLGRMRHRDGQVTAIVAKLEAMAGECGNAQRFALLADKIAARQSQEIIEWISCAAHLAEAREAAERLASALGSRAMERDAWIAEGRRREAAERDEAEQQRPARHRHRKPRLSVVGGTAAAASLAAASVAGGAYVAHDSAWVHSWAAPRPAAVRLHEDPPDSAVPLQSLRPSPRPSAAVASARPAPVVTPSVPVSSPPAPVPASQPPAPPAPDLIVPSVLHLDGNRGVITLTAGAQAVTWTLAASTGLSVGLRGGVLAPGQSVEVQVADGPGVAGWLYVSYGGTTVPVPVTSSLGNLG